MTLLSFIVAISILVVIHEYGHFWVARRCGVQVLRFSVGFGKPLFSLKDKQGTEYSVAPIPLGGYVKMLDSREATVPEHLRHQEFNSKSPWARIAIAAAGPLANFIFSVFVYWMLFLGGTTGLVPVIGSVDEDSPAAVAGLYPGDEILSVGGETAQSWQDVSWHLLSYIGETTNVELTVRDEAGSTRNVTLALRDWLGDTDTPEPVSGIGVSPRLPDLPLRIGQVMDDSPAQKAGMLAGDEIVAVNGAPVNDWADWVDQIRAAPDQTVFVDVLRNEQMIGLEARPKAITLDSGEVIGQIGVMAEAPDIPESWLRVSEPGVGRALVMGLEKTGQLIVFTLESLWKMITGDVSVKNLSGPITIAKVAGASASGGMEAFIGFLALLSVSLGVLNLLPVPMLDGGHILFYLAELVRGKPLPESVQIAAVKVGMVMLLTLMVVAFYNDISRL